MPISLLPRRRSELACRRLSLCGCAHKTGTVSRRWNTSDRNCGIRNPRPSQYCDRRDRFSGSVFPVGTRVVLRSTQHLSLGKSERKKLPEVLQAVLNAGLC